MVMQRGRKSAEQMAMVAVQGGLTTLKVRPAPWPGLAKREVELWKHVVDSLPVNWFGTGDLPLLAAYVRATYLHERASARLATAELVVTNDKGVDGVNPLVRVQTAAASTMASLSTKLKLTQSTRMQPQQAGARLRNGTNNVESPSARPWD